MKRLLMALAVSALPVAAHADALHDSIVQQGNMAMQMAQDQKNQYYQWLFSLPAHQRDMENALNDLMNQYEEQRGGRVLPPTQRNLATVPQMVGAATPEDVQFVQHRMQVKYESRRRMQDVNNKVENMLQDNCRSLRNVGVFIPGC